MESPFEVLDVEPGADEATIERAYRRRVKEVHPDLGGSAVEFRRVRAAYERLEAGGDGATLEDVSVDPVPETEPAPETGPAPEPGTDEDGAADGEDAEAAGTRVRYLDYEAIVDFGWDLDDPDLFETAADSDLEPPAYGEFRADPADYLLESAEACDYTWPFACRGGACANCAVKVLSGDLSLPVNHILPDEMVDRGIRLSCVGAPTGDELDVVFNVKHLPDLDDLRLPPRPFEQAYPND